jgi:peptidoglycan biosynthesis protein MviN/MurJ (putative lipid II flippase)
LFNYILNKLVTWDNVPYLTGKQCMQFLSDPINITVTLCSLVAIAYIKISYYWWLEEKKTPDSEGRRGLKNLRHIFLLCAACGYAWTILHFWFPAWGIYWLGMSWLTIVSWLFVFRGNKGMAEVYRSLAKQQKLLDEIVELKKANEEQRKKLKKG